MTAPFGPLLTSEEAARLIEQDAPTILDVRWDIGTGADRAAYLEGHIPGARFVDLDRQLAEAASERGRHPLPAPQRFASEMRALGVFGNRPVVVYDAASSMAAARAWWLLRYFGHPEVAVLDGGLASWAADGRPVSTEVPASLPGDFSPRPGSMPTITADEASLLATRGILIDARVRERFLGAFEPIDPVAGHIPGARNRPTAENLDPGGRFLAGAELRDAFERVGVRPGGAVAAYCGSGVTAAHEVLALELAGYRAALYPGSWSEWIVDPARPVAIGEE